jgi:hypothetical protein
MYSCMPEVSFRPHPQTLLRTSIRRLILSFTLALSPGSECNPLAIKD